MPQDIRAPDLATLDLYCDRVASAVGRLSMRVFGLSEGDGILLAHHLGRALQLTNILRDIDEDAGSAGCTCRSRGCCTRVSPVPIRSRSSPNRRCQKYARRWWHGRGRISRRPTKSCAAVRGAWCVRRRSCRNIIVRSWNCWSPEGSRFRARRFASTRWPASPLFFVTH